MGNVSQRRNFAKPQASWGPGHSKYCLANIHLPALALAVVDAPIPVLGMPVSSGHNFSAGIWLDLLRIRAQRPDDLRDLCIRISGDGFQTPHRPFVDHVPWAGYRRPAGPRGNRPVTLAAHAGSWRAGGAILRHGLPADHPPVRNFNHRPGANGFNPLAAWRFLWISFDPSRDHRHRSSALSAF